MHIRLRRSSAQPGHALLTACMATQRTFGNTSRLLHRLAQLNASDGLLAQHVPVAEVSNLLQLEDSKWYPSLQTNVKYMQETSDKMKVRQRSKKAFNAKNFERYLKTFQGPHAPSSTLEAWEPAMVPIEANGDCLPLSILCGFEISPEEAAHPTTLVQKLVLELRQCAWRRCIRYLPLQPLSEFYQTFVSPGGRDHLDAFHDLRTLAEAGEWSVTNVNVVSYFKFGMADMLNREVHELVKTETDFYLTGTVYGRKPEGVLPCPIVTPGQVHALSIGLYIFPYSMEYTHVDSMEYADRHIPWNTHDRRIPWNMCVFHGICCLPCALHRPRR